MTSLDEAAARICAHDPLLAPELARLLAERGTVAGPDGRLRWKHDPLYATPGPYPFQLEAAKRFWRNIRCPVLLVEGAESTFRHPEAEARHACFASARRVELPGAGHMIQRHQPARLAELLVEFLDS
jgi:pimeloyl-ACP methyl ester carboxylesterase